MSLKLTPVVGSQIVAIIGKERLTGLPTSFDTTKLDVSGILARMEKEAGPLSYYGDNAKSVTLFAGILQGATTGKDGGVSVFLRFADGPTCNWQVMGSLPPDNPMVTTMASPCNVGILDGLDDQSSMLIEGVA